jgi:hypothetical protein
MRKHVWKQKALVQAQKALFLAKYVLQNQDSVQPETTTVSDVNSNNA